MVAGRARNLETGMRTAKLKCSQVALFPCMYAFMYACMHACMERWNPYSKAEMLGDLEAVLSSKCTPSICILLVDLEADLS